MLKVYYKKGATEEVCYIRPVPLVSIAETPVRNKSGKFSTQYTITLNGTLISHTGSPSYDPDGTFTGTGPNDNFASSTALPDSYSCLPHSTLDLYLVNRLTLENYLDKITALKYADMTELLFIRLIL